ncbi:hypothetical protein N7492_004821 [Penicillium capsulatum]|uniref:CCZ1/INTU/HSP4 first Longin domain-containing protein n=1 Tax=Penicillium capsulatum TaxID=69766 RepID=A0A9W9IAN8_9EURO|nr:hypothetical protein N7492_004821 [Penicillium capsulatum]KAJ6136070.1 hypothetical protein N7512_001230 [Penicillium capsulatum]
MPGNDPDSVVPAQLSFLAIYNPTLGPTDETIEEQIVFYTSRSDLLRRTEGASPDDGNEILVDKDRNERQRQIGLAQGMVSFASNFSSGTALEYVETEKSRVVLLELEKNWWIVASMDLTRLPAEPVHTSSNESSEQPQFQYSSREMGHPQLMIQQLKRAHSIFLLLHDFSLDSLYARVGRASLELFFERFWWKFAWNWELLLTGNPIVEIYNGIKLAAGGELGIGVGEEEWGSGEREVLEDFVGRTDGLLDLVVSRFGDASEMRRPSTSKPNSNDPEWLGLDVGPQPADGIIFSGSNCLSRGSVARVSHWMEWIYRYGDAAYGIRRDPNAPRRRKAQKERPKQDLGNTKDQKEAPSSPTPDRSLTPGIPRPLVTAEPQSTPERSKNTPERNAEDPTDGSDHKTTTSSFGTETVMKYLTLGYGSSWSLSTKSTSSPPPSSPPQPGPAHTDEHAPNTTHSPLASEDRSNVQRKETQDSAPGYFLVGPRDDLETLDDFEDSSGSDSDLNKAKTRIIHRSVHVQLAGDPNESPTVLQAVIYVVSSDSLNVSFQATNGIIPQHQPFVFTFLFNSETPALSSPSLYSSIHHQLGPLQKPLLSSTSPATAASRVSISEGAADPGKRFSSCSQPVFDLVYDPSNLTIRSSIPNITSFGFPLAHGPSPSPSHTHSTPSWSRLESLAIHHRLLTTFIDTRPRPHELERTCKTNRGWWILWVRIPQPSPSAPLSRTPSSTAISSTAERPPSQPSISSHASISLPPQEAFLVRKASDHASLANQDKISSSARFFRDLGGASSSRLGSSHLADTTPSKLVEGLGMDARRYVEGLLRLNR